MLYEYCGCLSLYSILIIIKCILAYCPCLERGAITSVDVYMIWYEWYDTPSRHGISRYVVVVVRRYWLLDCGGSVADASLLANRLFHRLLDVPFIAKFLVFARSLSASQTRLRIFCVTDDKLDKTLERRQKYHDVARSQRVQVSTNNNNNNK